MKKTKKEYVLLHGHANAGPKGRRSYLKFKSAKTKATLRKEAKSLQLDGYRIAPKSSVKKTKHRGLYYVSK